jgi:hypothetical protein
MDMNYSSRYSVGYDIEGTHKSTQKVVLPLLELNTSEMSDDVGMFGNPNWKTMFASIRH